MISVGVFVNASPGKIIDRVGEAFGSSPGSENWDPAADINGDGVVDVKDLALASKNNLGTLEGKSKKTGDAYIMSPGSPVISVEPNKTVVRYLGENFSVDIDITDADETWAWQFNLTWDPSILNVTNITEGPFLSQGGTYQTSLAYGQAIVINYDEGWALVGNTLLEEPVAYPTGNGTLATINFTIPGDGSSGLTLHDTILVLGDGITEYGHSTEDGYFVLCLGDVNADGNVDIFDIGFISAHWYPGPPIGPLGYDSEADINNDGNVDIFDIGITSAHWNNEC